MEASGGLLKLAQVPHGCGRGSSRTQRRGAQSSDLFPWRWRAGDGQPRRGISQAWDCCPSRLFPARLRLRTPAPHAPSPWHRPARRILSRCSGICPGRDSCRQSSRGSRRPLSVVSTTPAARCPSIPLSCVLFFSEASVWTPALRTWHPYLGEEWRAGLREATEGSGIGKLEGFVPTLGLRKGMGSPTPKRTETLSLELSMQSGHGEAVGVRAGGPLHLHPGLPQTFEGSG